MCSLYPPKMSVVIFFTFFSLFFILEQNQRLTAQNTCRVGGFFPLLKVSEIACVPHLPQKFFSHFLCEGLCHSHSHSHGIDHFMDLGIYLGIGIGLCLGLCHFIGLGLGLCLGLKRKNSAEAELISKH